MSSKGILLLESSAGAHYINTAVNDVILQTNDSQTKIHISPQGDSNVSSVVSIARSNITLGADVTMRGTQITPDNMFNSIRVAGVNMSQSNAYINTVYAKNMELTGRITGCNWEIDTSTLQNFRINRIPYRNGLTIAYNGDMGVNTEFPRATLHVNGECIFNSNTTIHGDLSLDGDFYINSNMWVITGNSNIDYGMFNGFVYNDLYTARNVGIGFGMSNPEARLHFADWEFGRKIVLNQYSSNDHEYIGFATYDSNNAASNAATGTPNTPCIIHQVPDANHAFIFRSGADSNHSYELMRITGQGMVGIGVPVPTCALDVVGDLLVKSNITTMTIDTSNLNSTTVFCQDLTCSDNLIIANDLVVRRNIVGCNDLMITGVSQFTGKVTAASNLYVRGVHYVYGQLESPQYSNVDIIDRATLNVVSTSGPMSIMTASPEAGYALTVNGRVHVNSNSLFDCDVRVASNLTVSGCQSNLRNLYVMGDIFTNSNLRVQGGDTYILSNLTCINQAGFCNDILLASAAKVKFSDLYSGIYLKSPGMTMTYISSNAHSFDTAMQSNVFMIEQNGAITFNGPTAFYKDVHVVQKSLDVAFAPAIDDVVAFGSLCNYALSITNQHTPNSHLTFAYTNTYSGGVIQSVNLDSNVAKALFINPNGGPVSIGNVGPATEVLRMTTTSSNNPPLPLQLHDGYVSSVSTGGIISIFDTSGTGWVSAGSPPQYVVYQYGVQVLLQSYTMTNSATDLATSPNIFTMQGSADGYNWDVIDERQDIVWTGTNQSQTFVILNNKNMYQYFRLYIYSVINNSGLVGISGLVFSSAKPVVMSSSGNVGIGTSDPFYKLHVYEGSVVLDSTYSRLLVESQFGRNHHGIFLNYNRSFGMELQQHPILTYMTFTTDVNLGGFVFKYVNSQWDVNDEGRTCMVMDQSGFIGIGDNIYEPIMRLDVRGDIHLRDGFYKTKDIRTATIIVNNFSDGSSASMGVYRIMRTNGAEVLLAYIGYGGVGFFYVHAIDKLFTYNVAQINDLSIDFAIRDQATGASYHSLLSVGTQQSIQSFYITTIITASGKMGIGIPNPTTMLDTIGDTYTASNAYIAGSIGIGVGNSLYGYTPTCQLQLGAAPAKKKIAMYDTTSNNHQYVGYGYSNDVTYTQAIDSNANWTWGYGRNTSSTFETFRVSASNNQVTMPYACGIGWSNPSSSQYMLQVQGNVTAATYIDQNVMITAQNSNYMPFGMRTSNSDGMLIGCVDNAWSNAGPTFYWKNKNSTYGNMGINTTKPETLMHVVSDENDSMYLHYKVSGNGERRLRFGQVFDSNTNKFVNHINAETLTSPSTWSNSELLLNPQNGAGVVIGATNAAGYKLYVAGTTYSLTGYHQGSDARLKENIEPITGALDKLDAIHGYKFDYIDKPNDPTRPANKHIGLIAQEVEKTVPEVVSRNQDGFMSIAYSELMGVVVEAIRELRAEIKDIRAGMRHEA